MIKLHEIHKVYLQGKKGFHALKDITLYFERGEIVSIYGPSGCGKTTLLNILGGLDEPTSGHMVIGDRLTSQFGEKQWDYFRNHRIGFVFQSYNLIEHLPIVENVALNVLLGGVSRKEAHLKAVDLLKQVGLEKHLDKLPGQLSGGERQRVAIARALINDPDIILADEPTGALDTKTSHEIMDLIQSISKDKLVIIVTHNKQIAMEYSTRLIELKDGRVHSDTAPKDEKVKVVNKRDKKTGKLKFKEAIRLAYYNLKGKKWRTLLTSFGLSVGIVGLILIDAFFSSIRTGLEQQEQVIKDNPDVYIINAEETDVSVVDMEAYLNDTGYFKEVLIAPNAEGVLSYNVTDDAVLSNPLSLSLVSVPDNPDILNTFQSFVGDGRLPENDNEFAISLSDAERLVSSNSYLSDDEIWDLLKNNQYTMETSYDYFPDYGQLYEAVYNGVCVVTQVHGGTDSLPTEPIGYDSALLGNYADNVLALREYMDGFIQVSDVEEVYCQDYSIFEYYLSYAPSGEGDTMTLVGIYENNLFSEAIVTKGFAQNIEVKPYVINADYEANPINRFRAFIANDKIDDKAIIVMNVESDGYWVMENFNNGMGLFEGVISFFLYVVQFIFSSIIWIAILTGALMLLLILYISVLERKREIGILRAMGGTKKDVRVVYSGETTIIGLIAGFISVILSVIIVMVLNWYLHTYQLDLIIEYLPFIDPTQVLSIHFGKLALAIVGSIIIALLSGLIPAHLASKKKPIEALRND